jgi:predicted transcriptional regulator
MHKKKLKINPFKFKIINEFKVKVRELRRIGREKILERLQAIQNNEQLPEDMLTIILKSYSKNANFKSRSCCLNVKIKPLITFKRGRQI